MLKYLLANMPLFGNLNYLKPFSYCSPPAQYVLHSENVGKLERISNKTEIYYYLLYKKKSTILLGAHLFAMKEISYM